MSDLEYGFEKRLEGSSFEQAVEQVSEALKAEGFGILTEIDVKATLKKKIDADFRPYLILGACNPSLAHRALQADPHIGLLLPCNVVVQEDDEGVLVSIADPAAMLKLADNAEVEPVAKDAEGRLRRALQTLS